MKIATLILENGSRFQGLSFGYEGPVSGEVVFNTAMTGYPESLTDPSYAGQLMVLTYPLVGNYGVPPLQVCHQGIPLYKESERIHAGALIVNDYSEQYSHWNARESLGVWLKREKVPGITGIDTRRLTKELREAGVMRGQIVFDEQTVPVFHDDYGSVNYVSQVSCRDIIRYNEEAAKRVILLDCGVKLNILRCLLQRNVAVIRVPWDYDFTGLDYDGLFLSNGPGDPNQCGISVEHIRQSMNRSDKPIFGICLGNQLLAKAGGAQIYKLKYGHRSHNQPVRMLGTNRCFITSQNHGFAVEEQTLGKEWQPWFQNMNDMSNEGIRHNSKPWFSVQFHPEAASGPLDTEFLFDEFVKLL